MMHQNKNQKQIPESHFTLSHNLITDYSKAEKGRVKQIHKPVLVNEVLKLLKPQKGERYLDCTAGYGGHAEAVLKLTVAPRSAVLVDRDQLAFKHLSETLGKQGAKVVNQDFYF